jgi:hypothetical protein
MALCELGSTILLFDAHHNQHYSQAINTILAVGIINGYDIMSALREKLEYNKTRADHKRENRAKEGGKKF